MRIVYCNTAQLQMKCNIVHCNRVQCNGYCQLQMCNMQYELKQIPQSAAMQCALSIAIHSIVNCKCDVMQYELKQMPQSASMQCTLSIALNSN